MDITIIMLNGTHHTLTVQPDDTVGGLKALIHQRLGEPSSRQRLVFDLSDDARTAASYGLRSGSSVSLLLTQPAAVQVFLRNDKGRLSTYDVKVDDTVADFRARVEARERVPASQQRLVHEGREMMQGRLYDYGVRANSTIDLCLRLGGVATARSQLV